MTTFQLLVKELLHKWNTDRNTEQELIKITDDLCDVYILIDGLDEAENGVFSNPSKTTSMFETATADKIIKNIFEGRFKMLKNDHIKTRCIFEPSSKMQTRFHSANFGSQ